jgi:hypothetical protein
LSPEATEAMHHITPRGGPLDFGLGWFRHHDNRRTSTFVEHLGGGSGFFSVLRLYPGRRLGIALMGNTSRYNHEMILTAVLRTPW